MRYRPSINVRNACSPLAIAATIGGDPKDYLSFGSYYTRGRSAGKFKGMDNREIKQALLIRSPVPFKTTQHGLGRVQNVLPLEGRGLLSARRGRHWHSIAFDGKMVYDGCTGGRWMWVYDHPWAKCFVNSITFLVPKKGKS